MTPFLLSALILFVVWLAFFLFANETRREQLIMSLVGLVLSPGVLLLAASDTRGVSVESQPLFGIEDLLFAFSLFGIAAIIYQALIGKHTHKLRGDRFEIRHAGHWLAHLLLVLGLWVFCSLLLLYALDLQSIQALIVGGLLVGMYIIADRHDLLLDALLSGLFTAALVFIVEQLFFFRLFSILPLPSSLSLVSLLWPATVGFTIGPMYEWLRRYSMK